jgi:hypothetical protein
MFRTLAVTDHMIRHRDTDQETIKLQVLFVTGEKHWHEMDAIRLESPMLIVEYALQKRLVAKPHFSWVTSFCNKNDMKALVLKAKLAGREPKIKFGVRC